MKFENPKSVEITEHRWSIDIRITDSEGRIHEFIASADSAIADSGIWFASREETEEALA